MKKGADSARVAYPLFQEGDGGSIPTSALQLFVCRYPTIEAVRLNMKWHSRLPKLANHDHCEAFCAEFNGTIYAVALWSYPVARMLNGRGMYELRRMAVAPDAPKNTPSRFLRIMAALIKKARPDVKTLISYQDTAVHKGTIYSAAGWSVGAKSVGGLWSRPSRFRDGPQAGSPKIRWELRF